MSEILVEKHENIVIEMAEKYLDNMALELGKKYNNRNYVVNASLSDAQYSDLKKRHNLPDSEFADLYTEFQKMKPTTHLTKALGAFTESGGNIDIDPVYDEDTYRLNVAINFSIKDAVYDKIEGLSPLEDVILKMNAMIQIESVLEDADPDIAPAF